MRCKRAQNSLGQVETRCSDPAELRAQNDQRHIPIFMLNESHGVSADSTHARDQTAFRLALAGNSSLKRCYEIIGEAV